jgi:NAD(P)H-dependent FMN reductase
MLPTHVAARELERRRAEQLAEFARQLPLYVDDLPPMVDETEETPASQSDWTVNY